jgi:hypothetical protein
MSPTDMNKRSRIRPRQTRRLSDTASKPLSSVFSGCQPHRSETCEPSGPHERGRPVRT